MSIKHTYRVWVILWFLSIQLFSSNDLSDKMIEEETHFTHDESKLEKQVDKTKENEMTFIDPDQIELTFDDKSEKIVERELFDLTINKFEEKKEIMGKEPNDDHTDLDITSYTELQGKIDVLVEKKDKLNGRGNTRKRHKVSKKIKELEAKIEESRAEELQKDWDQVLLYQALSILRTDPASAHGFAPAQLLLGRPVVYPFELTKREIDLTEDEKQAEKNQIFETKRPNTKRELVYAVFPRIKQFCGAAAQVIIRRIFQFLDAIRPEYPMIMAHTNTVTAYQLSSDYRLLVSAGFDCSFRLWNVKDGSLIRTFYLPDYRVQIHSCFFISNNKHIISVQSRAIRLWEVTTGRLIHTCELEDYANTSILSPDEKFLLCDQGNMAIQMWSLETFLCAGTFYGHTSQIYWFQFRNHNQEVISAAADHTIRVWDATTQKCKRMLVGHTDCVRSCSLSTDQQLLASCGFDKTAKIWQINTGENIQTFHEHSNYGESSRNISRDSRISNDGRIETCSFVSEDKCVASKDFGGRIFIWRVGDGSIVHILNNIRAWCSRSMQTPWTKSYRVNIENSECLVLFSSEQQIQVVEVESGRTAFTFSGHYTKGLCMVDVTADGRILISSGMDGGIFFWDFKKNN